MVGGVKLDPFIHVGLVVTEGHHRLEVHRYRGFGVARVKAPLQFASSD